MEQHDLLKYVCQVLERLQVRYMVTGSQATIAYGEPRFTNDIDMVVDLDAARFDAFCHAFPEDDYYLSRSAAREALAKQGMFNIIHPTSGLKIDVIIPSAAPYDQLRLSRAKPVPIADDFVARMTTPEDIILKKLEWRQMGGGDRHLRDIAGVVKVQGDRLDYSYIQGHAERLGVASLWDDLLNRLRSDPA